MVRRSSSAQTETATHDLTSKPSTHRYEAPQDRTVVRTLVCLHIFLALAGANGGPEPSNYGANTYPASYSNTSPYAQDAPETLSQNALRHPANYTRTLVGPLSANACRLLDEHRKEGIFFLFQDLSVRTEGLFTFPRCVSCIHLVENTVFQARSDCACD